MPGEHVPAVDTISEHITAIVLAGGQGSRLGGQNKGLVTYGDKPLVQHVLDAVAPQVSQVVISANRDLAHYKQFGYPVIADQHADYRGPLAGIAAALDAVTTDYVLIVPCDMPHLPRDLVVRLADTMRDEQTNLAIAHDGERAQYLVALMHRDVAASARAFVDADGRAVKDWLATHSPAVAWFADQHPAFRNINAHDELTRN